MQCAMSKEPVQMSAGQNNLFLKGMYVISAKQAEAKM